MTIAEKTYSIEEFMALPDDGKRYDLIEGRVIEMSPASGLHGMISAAAVEYLGAYARKHRMGYTFGEATPFVILPGVNALSPDAAFVAQARLALPLVPDAPVPIPPDLAVEVLSAHDYNNPGEFKRKLAKYRDVVRLIWVIDPRRNRIEVYRIHDVKPALTLGLEDTLSGEDVLPGFTLPVRALLEPGS